MLTGGTDVHLVLVDLRDSELDGQQAEDRLHEVGITVNRNAVPFDPRPPMVTSGLRIGTPALATRGFGAADFAEVADIIADGPRPPDARRAPTRPRAARPRRRAGRRVTRSTQSLSSTRRHRHGATWGRRCPEHPDFLWHNPEPKALLRRRDRRRRRARPGDRLLPGQEPRHDEHRRAGEGLAGRREHGPQHHDHPLQLPVGRELAACTSTP